MIDRNKEITKRIDEKRHVAGLFPKIRKIIQEYDGKCYDKRFPELIRERTGERVFAQNLQNYYAVYVYGEGCRSYTLFRIEKTTDGRKPRINATAAIAEYSKNREVWLQQAADLEKGAEIAPMIKEQITELLKKINVLGGSIPYEIAEMYNIKHYYY